MTLVAAMIQASAGSLRVLPSRRTVPSSIAVDATGNVYVADMGNARIQVFDNEGTVKSEMQIARAAPTPLISLLTAASAC